MNVMPIVLRTKTPKFLREFHYSASLNKNTRAGVVRRTRNQSIPLTYEQTKKPHQIGVMKSWNSWNTSNLKGETLYTSEITLHDEFIRMFIKGTFPVAVESEVIIKRQYNIVRVAFLLSTRIQTTEAYFLMGYAEEMLSSILRCIVKLEVQMVTSKKDVIFRYI
ncbi:Mitochondrial ribosomal protein S24 [Fasciola gigantica]|uniref:Mitochondrial ribosomal protein S24 n=1 Tax=Fasciola gigantica TaxID=46835 RepID=A0A504YSQ6_FASGI|nr:Mitochondrial ribosomal protein S24 [Fasciola gigantica]